MQAHNTKRTYKLSAYNMSYFLPLDIPLINLAKAIGEKIVSSKTINELIEMENKKGSIIAEVPDIGNFSDCQDITFWNNKKLGVNYNIKISELEDELEILDNDALIKPGDVIVYTEHNKPIHFAIYLGDNYVLTKLGLSHNISVTTTNYVKGANMNSKYVDRKFFRKSPNHLEFL